MKNEHTPGPWSYNNNFYNSNLARVEIPNHSHTQLFALADARLIAAAPDLLEALEYCFKQCVASGHVSDEPHIIKARKAIALARGE